MIHMPLKLFVTLLIGVFVSAALSFINETLGAIGMFITGCFFGYFEAMERKSDNDTKEVKTKV